MIKLERANIRIIQNKKEKNITITKKMLNLFFKQIITNQLTKPNQNYEIKIY